MGYRKRSSNQRAPRADHASEACASVEAPGGGSLQKFESVVGSGLPTGYTCTLIGEHTGANMSAVDILSPPGLALGSCLQVVPVPGSQPAIGLYSRLALQGVGAERSAVGILDSNAWLVNARCLYDGGSAFRLNDIVSQQPIADPYHHQLLHPADAQCFAAGAIDPTAWAAGGFDLTGTRSALRFHEIEGQQVSIGACHYQTEHSADGSWSAVGTIDPTKWAANACYLSGGGMGLRLSEIVSQQLTANPYRDEFAYLPDRGWSAAYIAGPSKWATNAYGLSDDVAPLQFNDFVGQQVTIDSCRGEFTHLPDEYWSAAGVLNPGKSAASVYQLSEVGSALAFRDVASLHLTAQDYHDQLARFQDGGWSGAGIVDPGRWMANALYLPDTARALAVSEIMSQQLTLCAQYDQVAHLTRGRINATIRDFNGGVDSGCYFGAPSDAHLGLALRDARYTDGGDGLAVTMVSGMGLPITGKASLVLANPYAPNQFGPDLNAAWTLVRSAWPAEPEQSPPLRTLPTMQVLLAVVAGDDELPPTLPGADGLGILAAELLAALDGESASRPKMPAWGHSRSARTMCNCITEVNTLAETAGLQAIFKPTNRLVEAAAALPWLPAHNRSVFVEFLSWMYQAIWEGSGAGTRLSVHLTHEEREPLRLVNLLRTWAQHDVEHGDLGKVARKKRLMAEAFEILIDKKQPETRNDFLRAQSELSDRVTGMMRLLQGRLQARTIH